MRSFLSTRNSRMHLLLKVFLCCPLFSSVGFVLKAGAETSLPSGPASVVLLVLEDVSFYGSVRLGGEDYGDLKDSPDGGFFLPAKSGKNELRVKAQDCPDQPIVLNLVTGGRYLLTLIRVPNPDSKAQPQNSKILRHELIPLEGLPEAKGKAQVTALYLQGAPATLSGMVLHGISEPRRVSLPKGRVTSLGQGKTGMEISGQQVVFCNPADEPLVYLFILLEQKGLIRTVKAVF